jgi:hypothetical protein
VLSSYIGPKERDALAAAGAGKHDLGELIDLGFFPPSPALAGFLLGVYGLIRTGASRSSCDDHGAHAALPAVGPSIKSMIKMRELGRSSTC